MNEKGEYENTNIPVSGITVTGTEATGYTLTVYSCLLYTSHQRNSQGNLPDYSVTHHEQSRCFFLFYPERGREWRDVYKTQVINLALSMLFILLYIRYIMKVITDFNRLLRLSIVVCEVKNI